MIETIKRILGFGPAIDYKQLLQEGAVIIDVRTKGEFQSGHIKGAKNIPLQSIHSQLNSLKKEKVIITCCASGMRSGSAKSILKANGFIDVHNGGGWMSLQHKLQ